MFLPSDTLEWVDNIKAEVVGVVKEGEQVYGVAGPVKQLTLKGLDCRDLFYTVGSSYAEDHYKCIVLKEQVENLSGSEYLNAVLLKTLFFDLKDDLSEQEMKNAKPRLSNYRSTITYEQFRVNILRFVTSEVANILPLLACIFILMLVSSIALNGLSVKAKLKSFVIYYVVGARWSECIKMNFVVNLITTGLAIFMTVIAANVLSISGIWENTVTRFGLPQLAACAIVVAANLLVSLIMSVAILKANLPKDVLASDE